MNQKINRHEIIKNFHKMRKEYNEQEKESEIEILNQLKIKENEIEKETEFLKQSIKDRKKLNLEFNKNEIKNDIINKQQEFLSSINFDDIKIIIKYNEFIYPIVCVNPEYDIYNNQITYSIEYKNGLITDKKEIIKKVFSILYTKPHFIEFIDDLEIIHFLKNVNSNI